MFVCHLTSLNQMPTKSDRRWTKKGGINNVKSLGSVVVGPGDEEPAEVRLPKDNLSSCWKNKTDPFYRRTTPSRAGYFSSTIVYTVSSVALSFTPRSIFIFCCYPWRQLFCNRFCDQNRNQIAQQDILR